jgi:predicted DNA-binding transcriptional regulator AlpA
MQGKENFYSAKNNSLSFDELPQRVTELTSEIAELKTILREALNHQNAPQSEWLTTEQLASYLHRSKAWIYARTGIPDQLPPMHRNAGTILFRRSEVNQWMTKNSEPC